MSCHSFYSLVGRGSETEYINTFVGEYRSWINFCITFFENIRTFLEKKDHLYQYSMHTFLCFCFETLLMMQGRGRGAYDRSGPFTARSSDQIFFHVQIFILRFSSLNPLFRAARCEAGVAGAGVAQCFSL